MIGVICGSFREFINWVEARGIEGTINPNTLIFTSGTLTARMITRLESMRGVIFESIETYGSWYKLDEIEQIMQYAKLCGRRSEDK